MLLARLGLRSGDELDDGARLALLARESWEDGAEELLLATEHGRRLVSFGYEADVRWCAKIDESRLAPEMDGAAIK